MIKKLLYIFIFAFVFTACSNNNNIPEAQRKSDSAVPQVSLDNSFELVKEKGKLVVGVAPDIEPMVFANSRGELEGFDIDLAKEVADLLGIEVEFVKLSREKLMIELEEGRIDLAWSGLLVNLENEEKALLSKPYLKQNIILISVDEKIKKVEELSGKKVGFTDVEIDSVSAEIGEVKLVKYKNNKSLINSLDTNKVDAAIIDENYYKYFAHINDKSYNIIGGLLGSEEFAVATKKGNTTLMVEIDAKIQQLSDNGSFEKIKSKWFGSSKNL